MANDIIGGPEPVIIGRRLFYFSPLNDFELSALDAWVSWRLEKRCEALSDEGFSELETVAGTTQILYQSIHRNCSETVLQLAEFVNNDKQICTEIFNAWHKLNFEDFDLIETQVSNVAERETLKSAKQNFNETYLKLSTYYRWLPQQIAMLTPYQQLVYLRRYTEDRKNLPVHHDSVEEYFEWYRQNRDSFKK